MRVERRAPSPFKSRAPSGKASSEPLQKRAMRNFFSVCGCADPGEDLRPHLRLRRKSSSAKTMSSPDPKLALKLEELKNQHSHQQLLQQRASNAFSNALQQKYDDLEESLNKCKDELRDLQRNSVTAPPSHLRSKYVTLGAELRKCKDDLRGLHEEAKDIETESMQKKYEALEYALMKYRKEIEDELQKCWTQLKLLHLESQFASAASSAL